MTCSDCKYLNDSDRKEGCLCGALYSCKKINKYINGSNDSCESFEKSYIRNNNDKSKIYEEGNIYCDDDKSPTFYLFILIMIIIGGLILKLFC